MALKIKSTTHSEEFLSGIAKLLSDTTHKHYDAKLEVGGKAFYCHKLILAMKSSYFEQLLYPSSPTSAVCYCCCTTSLAEAAAADKQRTVLNAIDADAFDNVLQFIYTGETELSVENVGHILKAADLMKLTEITQFCVDFLTDGISLNTCCRYWRVADQMNLNAQASTCKSLCVKEFGRIFSLGLSRLTEKLMRELLEEDELAVGNEVDVCETLMKWLNSETESGYLVEPYQLLTLIRWSGVPVEYISTEVITNCILMVDRESYQFLSKVISYRLTGIQFSGLKTFHRPTTAVEQCVVIVGLNNGLSITADVYHVSLQRNDLITSTQAIPCGMAVEAAACVSGNQLYVTGVGESKNNTWKWESVFGWKRCADMIEGRRKHCATFVNNTSMYVLGGFDDDGEVTLDSIEQYNTVTNKWTKVGQLKHAAHTAACVVYKTSIYVFGGFTHIDVNLDYVQVFNTATKLCTKLTQRLPRPERLLRAVMWDKSVILINHRTCLIFDVEQHTFQRRKQFAAGVIQFGLVLENERIYIVGGGKGENDGAGATKWNCSDEVKSVAVMDIINNQSIPNWIYHAKLPKPALIHAYASMTLPT